MGWETIKGRRYFYETTYIEGKRIRRSWGRGPQAEAAAARVEQQQRARRTDLAQVKAFRDHDRQIDHEVKKFNDNVNHTIQSHLSQVGYHFCRRQWRKRRVQMSHHPTLNNLKDECRKVRKIEPNLTKNPQYFGDDIRRAALEALRRISVPEDMDKIDVDQTISEVEAKVIELRQEFQYEESNTFNRLVIEQVLTAWVQWYVAGWLLEAEFPDNRSLRQNQYFSQRYQQCQTRLTRAIDQLAKIRQIHAAKLKLESLEEQAAKAKRERDRRAKWDAEFATQNQIRADG